LSSRKLAKLTAALTVLVLLTGADGCKKRPTVDTDRPPQDRQVDPKRQRVVLIIANAQGTGLTGMAPYSVLVVAQERGKAGVDSTGPVRSAGGEYRQTLSYTSGLRIDIDVVVWGSEQDIFVCHVEDGSNRTQDRAYGKARCLLTTSR